MTKLTSCHKCNYCEKMFTKWGVLLFLKMPEFHYFDGFLLVKNRSAAKCLLNRVFFTILKVDKSGFECTMRFLTGSLPSESWL